MTDIIIDKEELVSLINEIKPELNKNDEDIFYLDETIPFKHLSTCEEGTITNLPFLYSSGYYIIYGYRKREGVLSEKNWINHITHVNVTPSIYWKDVYLNGKKYMLMCHHFCNSLNPTIPSQHFGNEGLIKATLSYNIRQQNPSDAYINAANYLRLFTNERALVCSKCGQPISSDANPIERVLRVHLACTPEAINNLCVRNYAYIDSQYVGVTDLSDDTEETYKNITREELQEALNNLKIEIDYTMVGCGSAGSNIAYQLAKTNLLNTCVLYDNDHIALYLP